MQTFEKKVANLTFFSKGDVNLKKILILEAKIRDVNSVSGEKLHDFEIICLVSGVGSHTAHMTLCCDLDQIAFAIIWNWDCMWNLYNSKGSYDIIICVNII